MWTLRTIRPPTGEWMWWYDGKSYSGDSLGLAGTNEWVDLSTIGWANVIKSFVNDTNCEVYGADSSWNYYGIPPWGYSPYVGSVWANRIYYTYIAQN